MLNSKIMAYFSAWIQLTRSSTQNCLSSTK